MTRTSAMFLCHLEELPEYGTRGFAIGQQEIFVIRQATQIWAYMNRCPHTGVTLNWVPDQFLDWEGRYVQCATHGALFRFEDGLCLAGPCPGTHLEPVPLSLIGGEIYLTNPGKIRS
ncbi:Rieske (2Fe-2S) protein [Nitrosococcus halophilus]|nr:Rieske 2Fe-2S domain-containing protein [Nitrosococcus halophilus]